MTIPQKEGSQFNIFNGPEPESLEIFRSRLQSKLWNFDSDNDKMIFLKTNEQKIKEKKETEKCGCGRPSCNNNEKFELALFVIQQQINSLNEDYSNTPQDPFSTDEVIEMNEKLDEILSKFDKMSVEHEIIFEEIEDLRSHITTMNKKTWYQLLRAKVGDITTNAALAPLIESVVKDGFNGLQKFLPTLMP